jgi:hypothetical protein
VKRAAHIAAWGTALVLGSALFALGSATTASAHEEVSLGPVDFEIGFHNEPAYAGFQNAVFLSIHHADGKPVLNAADTLKVQVGFGSQTTDVPLEPNFDADQGGEPGQYLANFIPTRPGPYTFHLSGSIAGQHIDRRFTSSSSTFDAVADPTSVEFPAKDPTLGQVAERLDREFPRINQAIAEARDAAESSAKTAKTLAIVALAVGAVGLAFGVIGLSRARRAGTAAKG